MLTSLLIAVSLMCFMGIWYLLNRFKDATPELAVLNTASLITLVIFFGGYAEQISSADWLLKAFGLVGLIIYGIENWQKKALKISAGMICISSMVAYLYLVCQSSIYSYFPIVDDYSHWGRMAQVIADHQRFVVSEDNLVVSDYPPGLASFEFFFLHLTGFSIPINLFAQGVFSLAYCTAFYSRLIMHRSNDATKFIFLSLAIYSLIWIFQHGFHTLWADLPLGILFGVAIYLYFSTAQTRSTYELVTLAATLAVMALIKQIGIVFVAMTLALIGLDLLIQKNKNKRHSVAIFLMLFSIPLLVNSLWRHYAKLQGLNKTFSPHFSFQDAFLSIWPSTATARQVITRERFIDYVFFTHHMGTYWFVVLIVALISLHYMHLKHSLERPRRLLITWLLVPEFFAYLGFLLLLYMFSFTEWEGVRLASIDRYSNSFLLGAVMAVLGLLAYQTELLRSREIKAPWFFVVTLLCILPNFGRIWFDTKNSFTNPEPVSAPYQIKNLASKILPTIDRDASIYLIWQGGSNDELTIFQFFMRPHQVNSSCASIKTIASLNDENDPWSCKKTVDAFKANLHKFDYLVIGKADFDFSENFLKHLRIDSVKNGDIYKIIHSDQKISLDPVSIQINSKSKITDQNQP